MTCMYTGQVAGVCGCVLTFIELYSHVYMYGFRSILHANKHPCNPPLADASPTAAIHIEMDVDIHIEREGNRDAPMYMYISTSIY